MKTKNLWKYAIAAFIVSTLGCSFFFYIQKKAYTRLEKSAGKLALQEKENLSSLMSAYNKKYYWLNSLIHNSNKANKDTTTAEIYQILNQLNSFQIKTQVDLNKFELWNIKLNQALIKEVMKYNSQQKSFFSHISQIRELERYDRHIDFVRTQYSTWSYQYYQAKIEMGKNLFSKNSSVAEVPFFEIDHLIFKKKTVSKHL